MGFEKRTDIFSDLVDQKWKGDDAMWNVVGASVTERYKANVNEFCKLLVKSRKSDQTVNKKKTLHFKSIRLEQLEIMIT